MHEVGLMQRTLEIALEHAARHGARRISRMTLRVGTLSGVVPEALSFAFDIVMHGTIAEGAGLELETVPVVCFCPACEQEFAPPELFYECPRCHQLSTQVRQGQELELAYLEVSGDGPAQGPRPPGDPGQE
jgi:hydrogenase nickel incorporation protein HypA/HybF